MMHDHRGFLVMLFGLTLSIATACDAEDDGSSDGIDERTEAGDNGDINDGGQVTGCAAKHDYEDCRAELGCAPVLGQELFDDGDGWCTDSSLVYIACMDTSALCTEPDPADCEILCPAIEQTLCVGDRYWRASGCVPDHSVCTAPGELIGECGGGKL